MSRQPLAIRQPKPTLRAVELSRGRQYLTRYQERRIRSIFPFFKLPAELRNMVYEYCIDITGAEKLIDRYYHTINDAMRLKPATEIKDVEAPLIYSSCSPIFLLNRQTYAEATFLLRKRDFVFTHGMLDLLDIQDFIKPNLIRSVSSITINDSGHPLFQHNILSTSWLGQMLLIEQIARILSVPGHRLKKFTIALTTDELSPHVGMCWNASFACGFRDTLRRASAVLRRVHDIPEVNLVGFPSPLAEQLKASMQSPAINFLDLPRELRDNVYEHALDWSDISSQLARTTANWVDKSASPPYPKRSTPTVLLLNRKIADEASQILHKKPLTIVCPRDHNMTKQDQVPNLLRFISPATLKNVQHLVLKVESWEWIYSLDYLLLALATATSAPSSPTSSAATSVINISHSTINNYISATTSANPSANRPVALKTLHLHFRDSLKSRFLKDSDHHYPDSTLHLSLSKFKDIRNLTSVSFSGDLPAVYTVPLAQMMQSGAAVDLMAVKGDGAVVEIEED